MPTSSADSPNYVGRNGGPPAWAGPIVDGLALRGGVDLAPGYRRDEARKFEGIGFRELARYCLRNEGIQAPDSDGELYQRAISSVSLPEILGATAAKVLQAAYLDAPGTVQLIAGKEEVANFHPHSALRLSKFASVPQVGAGGEVSHATLSESKEIFRADTYGLQFGLTRRDWINDSLGAFVRIPRELADLFKRNITDLGIDLLTSAAGLGPTMNEDSTALFDASRADGSNYYVNAAAALSAASLAVGKSLLRSVKQGGVLLNLAPKFLLVPAALEYPAKQLVNSQEIRHAATKDVGTFNPHQGLAEVIVEPRLDGKTDGTTAWYLLADPLQAPTLCVVSLRGYELPTIERVNAGDILGFGFRAYHDAGVTVIGWRGAFRSKGAA